MKELATFLVFLGGFSTAAFAYIFLCAAIAAYFDGDRSDFTMVAWILWAPIVLVVGLLIGHFS